MSDIVSALCDEALKRGSRELIDAAVRVARSEGYRDGAKMMNEMFRREFGLKPDPQERDGR